MNFEITGFSQKLTALIQKDEGFRYKCVVGSFGALQMLKRADLSGSTDTKEQKVRRTTTKCSEQRLFVKQNPRQFSMTFFVILNLLHDLVIRKKLQILSRQRSEVFVLSLFFTDSSPFGSE